MPSRARLCLCGLHHAAFPQQFVHRHKGKVWPRHEARVLRRIAVRIVYGQLVYAPLAV